MGRISFFTTKNTELRRIYSRTFVINLCEIFMLQISYLVSRRYADWPGVARLPDSEVRRLRLF